MPPRPRNNNNSNTKRSATLATLGELSKVLPEDEPEETEQLIQSKLPEEYPREYAGAPARPDSAKWRSALDLTKLALQVIEKRNLERSLPQELPKLSLILLRPVCCC